MKVSSNQIQGECRSSVQSNSRLLFNRITGECNPLSSPLEFKIIPSEIILFQEASLYCKGGHFHVGVIFHVFLRFRFLCKNYSLAKIKPICLYEGNRSSIVKITPMWNVLPIVSQNYPPAKITTFTVGEISFKRNSQLLNSVLQGEWNPSLLHIKL